MLACIFPVLLFSAEKEQRKATDLVAQKEVKQAYYHLKTGLTGAIVLSMPYGEPDIITETDRKKIKESLVLRIDLVFSDFPKAYDLKKLNLKRVQEIAKIRKDLVSNPDIEWRIIRQTSCTNEAEAKTLFHGVVIHMLPLQSGETIREDLEFMKGYLSGDTAAKRRLPDSTVFKVFKRNKNWSEMLIVSDITGSMAPYTTQLILWFKLNMDSKKVKDIVFFNDGDSKADKDKKLGVTGGIYHTRAKTYEEVVELSEKAIKAGNGGDCPENDIEALLAGMKFSPDAKEIILIADNFAPIKDYALIEKLDKPVRVILCGATFSVNTQYLDLARKTGGSVHTMEEDLMDLIKLMEGSTIKFNHRTFLIEKGSFVEVKKS